jgi:hypothetical protein
MSNRPEPDDVDLFVGGIEPEARSPIETARTIEEYKKRPDYPLEAEEAERILAALGIDACEYGIQDSKSLLEHWRGSVAELLQADFRRTNGTGVDKENTGFSSGLPSEKADLT